MPDAHRHEDSDRITLYRLHGCPYCERVVERLERHDVGYRSRFVAGEKSRRDVVKRIAGTRSVPVIVDPATGVTMAESGRIVTYIDRTYGEGIDGQATAGVAEEGE